MKPLPAAERYASLVGAAVSALLLVAAAQNRLALSLTEVLGFITGAACVYLVAKGSIWNFPIGLANNFFFAVLFFQTQLYNDMALQGVFFVLGVGGWYWWLRGARGNPLSITRAPRFDLVLCLLFVGAATPVLSAISLHLGGAATFWDALTTALSLAAQWLLNRKKLENWLFWIAADIIYIPLYYSRELYLTSFLYFGFLLLCIAGWRVWKRDLK